ncbi:hypothetical protein KKG63_00420, partial [Patescibacteria group bacterium]|nr:hypothetical protein [Patescibacteria group bacterium]
MTNKGRVKSIKDYIVEVEFLAAPKPQVNTILAAEHDSQIKLMGIKWASPTILVCLALFGKTMTIGTDMWIGDRYVGCIENIEQYASTLGLASAHVTFNDPEGGIGLYAIDNCYRRSIAFCEGSEIPANVIKHSSRTVTRISISP